MKFALSVLSLDGSCRRLELEADATLLMAELEQGLPQFHELRLFQGERDIVVGGALVEVELQSVVVQSPSKAIAVFEAFFEQATSRRSLEALPETFHAAKALGEMEGELSADDSARLFSICRCLFPGHAGHVLAKLENLQIVDLMPVAELSVAIGATLGRKCVDPERYTKELCKFLREGWASSALAEIVARGGQLPKEAVDMATRVAALVFEFVRLNCAQWEQVLGIVRLLGQIGDMSHRTLLQNHSEAAVLLSSWCGEAWAEKLRDDMRSAVVLIESREQTPARSLAADSVAMTGHLYTHNAAWIDAPDVEGESLQDNVNKVESCATEEAIRHSREEFEREQITSAIVGSILSKKMEDVGVLPPASSDLATLANAHSEYAASKGSCASAASFISGLSDAGPKCFLPGSLLKMRNQSWALVEEIKVGQWVLSYEGEPLQVKRVAKHVQDETIVTELVCTSVTMRFTNTHPVVTPSPEGYKLAGDLVEGDHVSIATSLPGGVIYTETHPLTSVRSQRVGQCDVYELIFDPDKPVESFLEPIEKILSKGPNVNEVRKRHCHRQAKRLHKLKDQVQRATPDITPANSDSEHDPAAASSAQYVQSFLATASYAK